MNPFSERYKSHSFTDLLRVLENAHEYESEAVEAARREIDLRQIPDSEKALAKKELQSGRMDILHKRDKRLQRTAQLKCTGTSILDLVNPIQKATPTAERLIRLLTLIFGIMTLYAWGTRYSMIHFLFSDNQTEWYFIGLLYLLPLVLRLVITVLLVLRKKWGWILSTVNMILIVLNSIYILFVLWNMETPETYENPGKFEISGTYEIGDPFLDGLIPQLLIILFSSGILWVLARKEVRYKFKIDQQVIYTAIGISVILEAFLIGMNF